MKNWPGYTVFLLLFTFSVQSQNVVISDVIELQGDAHYEIIGMFGHRILVYRESSKEIDILAFDKNMQQLWSKPVEKKFDKAFTAGIVPSDTSFHLFLAFDERDSASVYHYIFNESAELREEGIQILKSADLHGRFFFEPSKDGSKVVFFQAVDDKEVRFVTYDVNEKKVLWNDSLELESKLRHEFLGLELTNSGEVYMVLDKENQRYGRKDHYYEVHYFQGGGLGGQAFSIPFSDYLTQSAKVVYDEMNKALNITGYYTEKNLSRAEGVFYFTFSPQDPDVTIARHAWDEDIKISIYGPQGGGAQGIEQLKLKRVIPREDGGLLLIGEVEKIYERRTTYAERGLYNGGSNWVDFIYEDMVLVSVHPDGAWHWGKVLHKRQFSQDDNAIFSSFYVFDVPSFIRIIYNDEISNNSTASAYEVLTDGSYSRTSILSTQYQKLQLRFQEAFQYSSTAMIVPSEHKGRLKLVHIQF